MQNILDTIVAHKHREVALRRQRISARQLARSPHFKRQKDSLVAELRMEDSTGIIAEFKRRSPSKGIINNKVDCAETLLGYELAGAAGVSVLTDGKFFGGHIQDLFSNREYMFCPLLRKDFMVEEYQFLEAKAAGADVVLLIAACLTPAQVKQFTMLAKSLDLEVLLELHEEKELDHICPGVDFVGINNRNLKTFEVNWQHSIDLAGKLPAGMLKIAESGIGDAETLLMLKQAGFNGFLMGELFMKYFDPAIALADFVKKLNQLQGIDPAWP